MQKSNIINPFYIFHIFLISLILLISFLALFFLNSWLALPNYGSVKNTTHLKLPIVKQTVQVKFDKYAIPSINAQSEEDAYLTLGFLLAQERLAQLELQRRTANGTLSEVFGKKTLKNDILVRSLHIRSFLKKNLTHLQNQFPEQMQKNINAYLSGINFFIKDSQKRGTLPFELRLLGITPKPFTLLDIMSFLGYMSFNFDRSIKSDLLVSKLKNLLSIEKFHELMIPYPQHAPVIFSQGNSLQDKQTYNLPQKSTSSSLSIAKTFNKIESISFPYQLDGSNSWVLSGERTTSGFPLLANDPHMKITHPSIWFKANIKTPNKKTNGHFLSFIPFPILAYTDRHSWAFTVSYIDDFDLFHEKRNPQNKQQILYKNQWTDLKTHTELIKVRNSKILELSIEVGPHGPILDPSITEKPTAVQWSFHHKENNTLLALYLMGDAQNMNQFQSALKHGSSPGINISYADKNGNIAWWVFGKIPLRPKKTSGRQVLDGFSGKNDWLGYLPFEQNPHLINPKSGVIVTANNLVSNSPKIQSQNKDYERASKITKELNKHPKWSIAMTKKLQINEDAAFWPQHKNLIKLLHSNTKEERDTLNHLSLWSGTSSKESIGATIYHTWLFFILKTAIVDELKEDNFNHFYRYLRKRIFLLNLLKNERSLFWDDIGTGKKENRQDIFNIAFKQSIHFLKNHLGNKVDSWQWGKLHQLEFSHPLSLIKPLKPFLNRGPYHVGGGTHHINALAMRFSTPFRIHAGPTTRRIINFSKDHPSSWEVTPPGNSGHFLSSHYDDQISAYINNEYIQSNHSLENKGNSTLTISP